MPGVSTHCSRLIAVSLYGKDMSFRIEATHDCIADPEQMVLADPLLLVLILGVIFRTLEQLELLLPARVRQDLGRPLDAAQRRLDAAPTPSPGAARPGRPPAFLDDGGRSTTGWPAEPTAEHRKEADFGPRSGCHADGRDGPLGVQLPKSEKALASRRMRARPFEASGQILFFTLQQLSKI